MAPIVVAGAAYVWQRSAKSEASPDDTPADFSRVAIGSIVLCH